VATKQLSSVRLSWSSWQIMKGVECGPLSQVKARLVRIVRLPTAGQALGHLSFSQQSTLATLSICVAGVWVALCVLSGLE